MTEQTDAAEVLTAAESNALCEALDADGCHGFLHDHVETLAALGRLLATREAAAEARGAERALREAAEAARAQITGHRQKAAEAGTVGEYAAHAARAGDWAVFADWLRARAAAAAGGAR